MPAGLSQIDSPFSVQSDFKEAQRQEMKLYIQRGKIAGIGETLVCYRKYVCAATRCRNFSSQQLNGENVTLRLLIFKNIFRLTRSSETQKTLNL